MARKVMIEGPISGQNWSYRGGDVVELADDIAQAWIDHGLATDAPPEKISAQRIAELEKSLDDAIRERDALRKSLAEAEGKAAEARKAVAGAKDEASAHKKSADEAIARALAAIGLIKTEREARQRAEAERDDFAAKAKALGEQLERLRASTKASANAGNV